MAHSNYLDYSLTLFKLYYSFQLQQSTQTTIIATELSVSPAAKVNFSSSVSNPVARSRVCYSASPDDP